MRQNPKTPEIKKCSTCGAEANVIDWHFIGRWKVYCKNNHTKTGQCNSRHRAICLWNNKN